MTGRSGRVLGLLFFVILVNSGQGLVISPQPLSWTDAQAFCRDNQSYLIPGTKAGFPYPHWTGYYHRLSDWIHVLGCYESQDVLDLKVTSNLTLSRGSVGLCQERCGSQNFALKNTTCLCLTHRPQGGDVSTSRCHWNCSAGDESHVNDCGGSDTYNVYGVTITQEWTIGKTVNCLVLGCYEKWNQVHADNCTEDLGRICQSEASTNKTIAPDEDNFKSWSETYTECRNKGSYLFGNFSADETSGSLCNRLYDIRSNTPETWLGVARQVFLTRDRGVESLVESVVDCSICHGLETGCAYVAECNSNSMKATAVCGNADDLLLPEESTTAASSLQTPAPNTGDNSKRNIAITVPIVLVAVVGVLFVSVIVVRRRRQKSQKCTKNYTNNTLYGSAQKSRTTVATTGEDKSKSLDISGKMNEHHYHEIEFQKKTKPVSVTPDKSVTVSQSKNTSVVNKIDNSTQLPGGQGRTKDTIQNKELPSAKGSGGTVSDTPDTSVSSTNTEQRKSLDARNKPPIHTEPMKALVAEETPTNREPMKPLVAEDTTTNKEPMKPLVAEDTPTNREPMKPLVAKPDKSSTDTENVNDKPEVKPGNNIPKVDSITGIDLRSDEKAQSKPGVHTVTSEETSVPVSANITRIQASAIKESDPPSTRQINEGKPVNKKNVSVIQVSRI